METTRRSTASIWLGGALLLTSMLYLASLGPAAWWVARPGRNLQFWVWWDVYVAPANWLARAVPAINDPLDRYILWWAEP